jgi:mercuric ion binding protein
MIKWFPPICPETIFFFFIRSSIIMKHILFFSLGLFLLTFTACSGSKTTTASTLTQTEFTVNGNCGMCKERIENALTIPGVKTASWSFESQSAKVIYNSAKVSEKAMQAAIAEAGHDTEKVKATDEAYGKLHACCNYRENPACGSEK